jgi:hypothetical protein
MRTSPYTPSAPRGTAGACNLANAVSARRTGRFHWRGAAQSIVAIGLTLLLGACAAPRMVGSQVESFVGTAGAVTGATYRFERLPSQQSKIKAQERVENMAQAALQSAGLTFSDAHPRYSVQVDAHVEQFRSAARRSPQMIPYAVNADGLPSYAPLMFVTEPPWYLHTVHIVLRDIASGQIAYETTGRYEGPWSDTAAIWPVVMQASLEGYPNPPQGDRIVTIELPTKGANAP